MLFICRDEYLFNFNNTFEIHDDIEVLKRMGMAYGLEKGLCTDADLQKCMRSVPKALEPYVLGKLQSYICIYRYMEKHLTVAPVTLTIVIK